jgi:hypothetical protein
VIYGVLDATQFIPGYKRERNSKYRPEKLGSAD